MSLEVKIEEVTKIIARKMYIGQENIYLKSQTFYNNRENQDRYVYINAEVCNMLSWGPKIKKDLLGWGCQVVKPPKFRKILKGIKKKGFVYKEGEVEVTSFVNVVRAYGRKTVNKAELIEKMELLLKIYSFLYKK